MYTPTQYKVEDSNFISEILLMHPFATLLSREDENIKVSHLPFLYNSQSVSLLSHMASANTQKLSSGQQVKILFHGPHAYVSPIHYEAAADNVPTWNYLAIHVSGVVEIIDDRNDKVTAMKQLIEHFESTYETGWKYENTPEQQALFRGIKVFRIKNLKFEAKFKLSQNQSQPSRLNVIEGLPSTGKLQHDALEVAGWMKRIGPSKT